MLCLLPIIYNYLVIIITSFCVFQNNEVIQINFSQKHNSFVAIDTRCLIILISIYTIILFLVPIYYITICQGIIRVVFTWIYNIRIIVASDFMENHNKYYVNIVKTEKQLKICMDFSVFLNGETKNQTSIGHVRIPPESTKYIAVRVASECRY